MKCFKALTSSFVHSKNGRAKRFPIIIKAVLDNELLNACSTYQDFERGFTVRVEFPVNLINVNSEESKFQVCAGPVLLPNLATWNGDEVGRIFKVEAAFSEFDFIEFILRREVEASPKEREWYNQPRGQNRLKFIDPNNPQLGYPPESPKPTVYNETWELKATNVILRPINA